MVQDFHLNDWGAGVHVFQKSKLCDSEHPAAAVGVVPRCGRLQEALEASTQEVTPEMPTPGLQPHSQSTSPRLHRQLSPRPRIWPY